MYYANSIAALQQLLFSGLPPDAKEEGSGRKKNVYCHITKKSHITHTINGIEYCSVEVTCDNGSQYGIQAYGDEAIDLYKEIYKCCMCGMPPKGLKRSTLIEERIDGTTYTFDRNECALIFKKLRSVMGEEKEEEARSEN
jgi:hypothetical protein